MKGGLSFDWHGWRGFFLWPRAADDLFHFRITLGLVTIWICKFCVHERLIQLARKAGLDDAKKFEMRRVNSEADSQ